MGVSPGRGRIMTQGSRPQIDVIIPAHGEQGQIDACLSSLLTAAEGVELRAIVSANGAGWEETLTVAARREREFMERGFELRLVGHAAAGKPEALNRGDRLRRECCIAYLDADIRLQAGTLKGLASVLSPASARLATPRRCIARPRTWLSRQYLRVWEALPAVSGDVIGSGCYAVNPAGRRRWGRFPNVLADDAFVRSRFAAAERTVCMEFAAFIAYPEWPQLAATVRRWRAGNRQLREIAPFGSLDLNADPGAGLARNARWLIERPELWMSLPPFIWVRIASYFTSFRREAAWRPARSQHCRAPGTRDGIVSRHQHPRDGGGS